MNTSPLQSAIDYLGAVEVAPGRYAFRRSAESLAYPGHRYYVATIASMRILPDYLATAAQVRADREDGYEYAQSGDAYGALGVGPDLWLARWGERRDLVDDLLVVRMPSWWTPECRFACNDDCHGTPCPYSPEHPCKPCDDECKGPRITASLETGEEIPA